MTDIDFLHTVRKLELDLAVTSFPDKEKDKKCRVLELGAGTGEQARLLAQKGYEVAAIDMPSSAYYLQRVFPVTDYDGKSIPYPSNSFDVIFSSNVLEHVEDIDLLLEEIKRVMKPSGRAVHILPTSTCRLWGIAAHYGWLTRRTFDYFFRKKGSSSEPASTPKPPRSWKALIKTIFPTRHGERGNVLTEAYYFSSFWWKKQFIKHGFRIRKISSNQLFYTMANAFSEKLPLKLRAHLSKLFGSACKIYVLTLKENSEPNNE